MKGKSRKRAASGRKTAKGTPALPAAIEATRLLGKWMRVAQGHVSFGMGCSCGMGTVNIQTQDFELQILDYLYGKHSKAGAEPVLALLRVHAHYRPGEAGSITAFLRAIATQSSVLAAELQLALLRDLERGIDSFDEAHRS
jgi:hypothetical protein